LETVTVRPATSSVTVSRVLATAPAYAIGRPDQRLVDGDGNAASAYPTMTR